MARARTIKPGFFTNEEIVALPFEYRLLFIGLWTLADRDGRLEYRPKRIRMEVFPADDVDCEKGMQALLDAGLLVMYEVEGNTYIWIPAFVDHQKPHPKERASIIPPYLEGHTEGSNRVGSLVPSGSSGSSEKTLMSGDARRISCSPLNGKGEALQILAFLNEKTGHAYRPVKANLNLISARLKEGATVMECRQVIAKKSREWATDEKMAEYLRPATLFNATKFAQYVGELVVHE